MLIFIKGLNCTIKQWLIITHQDNYVRTSTNKCVAIKEAKLMLTHHACACMIVEGILKLLEEFK